MLTEPEFLELLDVVHMGDSQTDRQQAYEQALAAYREQGQALAEARADNAACYSSIQKVVDISREPMIPLSEAIAMMRDEAVNTIREPHPGSALLDELTRLRAERDALAGRLGVLRPKLADCEDALSKERAECDALKKRVEELEAMLAREPKGGGRVLPSLKLMQVSPRALFS